MFSATNYRHSVHEQNDINEKHNEFNDIIAKAFNGSFITKQFSRRRAKDKKWITAALKNSCNTKNSLCKCRPITCKNEDAM